MRLAFFRPALPTALSTAITAVLILASPAHAKPIEVTRFHLSQPLAGKTIMVVPPPGTEPASLEFQGWATAIAAELARAGFQPVAAGQPAELTAVARIETQSSTQQRRSGFSIGIGGGFGGGGFGGGGGGIGGGASFPVGKGRTVTLVDAKLNLQIMQSSDGAVQWEGRAGDTVKPPELQATITRLARAMLTGFPGVSGKTVKVNPAR